MGTDAVFAVIAEGTRRLILETLRDGDRAVGELVDELGVSQPTVSKHLKVLREAGLVTTRAQGQKRYYSLDAAPLDHVRSWLALFEVGTDTEGGPRREATGGPDAVGNGGDLVGVEATAPSAPLPSAAEFAPADRGSTAEPASTASVDLTAGDLMEAVSTEPAPDALAVAILADPGTPTGVEPTRPIGRTMGRAAERAADLLSQLRRRRDPSA